MAANRILLFGDSADAPLPLIRQLRARSRSSKHVQAFVQKVVDAVGREVEKLSPSERSSLGMVSSLQALEECSEGQRDHFGLARITLLLIARIGQLILHVEKDPSLLMGNVTSAPVIALSISGSLLPAAAAGVSHDIEGLIEVGTYMAAISCRLAVQIKRRANQVEREEGRAWAYSFLGSVTASLPKILAGFNETQDITPHKQAYVAVHTSTWATVMGAPSVLRTLLESSEELRASNPTAPEAVSGPVHGPHLICPRMESLIDESDLLDAKIKSNYRLISGSKYKPMQNSSLRTLLPEILEDILQRPTNPEKVFEAGFTCMEKNAPTSLYVLGNTHYTALLRQMLRKTQIKIRNWDEDVHKTLQSPDPLGSVAIVGMAGRFPGSESVDELWASLIARKEFHQPIPTDRFDVQSLLDLEGRVKNGISAPYGCFLEHPDLFDHKMFAVSPREAMRMDPGFRLLLQTTHEALENAGVTRDGTRATNNARISTFVGLSGDDWRELQEQSAGGVDLHMIQGTQRAFAPGRLNYHFKWEGAAVCVDSACGSSALAVGLAFKALVDRDCDTAIAGGSNIIATPYWHSACSRGGFLSPSGGCKTFRDDADGYCRGEAVGALVLKRLDDALADNDNIISIIRGYARNHSAEAASITRPHSQTQEKLFRSLLYTAGLEARTIDYVECHGTGTTAGDSAELESVANVFAKQGSREEPLVVGGVKANVGHTEAMAGILSLIKASLIFQNAVIPPQVGIPERLGHHAPLRNGQIRVPENPLPFKCSGADNEERRIVVNNFDAAGGNTSFLLEEPPRHPPKRSDPRGYHVVACSANSRESLLQNKQRMLRYLNDATNLDISDLAYTTTARRMHHKFRVAYSGREIVDIVKGLTSTPDPAEPTSPEGKQGPLVFVFSGQGGVYAGMAKRLFHTSHQFRGLINNYEQICESLGFPSFQPLIVNPDAKVDSADVVSVHLALVAMEIALAELWQLWGIEPDLVIGHSIGEYAALCVAGVLSPYDALLLTGRRAQLIQSKCVAGSHGMLSISGPPKEVSDIVTGEQILSGCEVACFNTPGTVVVSGERRQISTLQPLLSDRGLKTQLLDVPYGMHSRQMDCILPDLGRVARDLQFARAKVKFISTSQDGQCSVTEPSFFGSDYLIRHTRHAVHFEQTLSYCKSEGLIDTGTQWLDIGPDTTCAGLIRAHQAIPARDIMNSLQKGENDWKPITNTLTAFHRAGRAIRWRDYHKDFVDSLSLVSLPSYAFDTKRFWMAHGVDEKSQPAAALETRAKREVIHEFQSHCLHQCIKREDEVHRQTSSFIANISHAPLLEIIEGHQLSGMAVCPAGVYMDMALTAAQYVLTGSEHPKTPLPLVLTDVQIHRPLVPDPSLRQIVHVITERRRESASELSISFSVETRGARAAEAIAECVVRVQKPDDIAAKMRELSVAMQEKVSGLNSEVTSGRVDRIAKRLFYRMFSHLMKYSDIYQGITEATVSDDFSEMLAQIRFPPTKCNGLGQAFVLSPYWNDIVGQSIGFLLNGNPEGTQGDYVFVGQGLGAMYFDASAISPDICYQIYANLKHSSGSIYSGNAYVLHQSTVVAFVEDLRLHKVSRNALHIALSGGRTSSESLKTRVIASTPRSSGSNGLAGPADSEVSEDTISEGRATRDKPSLIATFVDILLDETGLSESELGPSLVFLEAGVDSMLSITILARLKAEVGVELGVSFLVENATLDEAKRALRTIELQDARSANVTGPSAMQDANKQAGTLTHRISNAVLISASSSPASATRTLFLIADGAGSAAAYTYLPQLHQKVQVFALESPWVHDPENFDCTFHDAAAIYVAAIRDKQPQGPYLLGGWSAGGLFAYEVARRLLEAGESVSALIIIDMTAPKHLDMANAAVAPTPDLLAHIGMFTGIDRASMTTTSSAPTGIALAPRLKQHMSSTVRCFSKLVDLTRMTPARRPERTCVVWAEDKDELFGPARKAVRNGVNLNAWFYPGHDDSHERDPQGWDKLTCGDVECFSLPGDHFSIMTMPKVKRLVQILQLICSESVAKAALDPR